MILWLLLGIWFKNPRIVNSPDSSKTLRADTAHFNTDILVEGEKAFYAQGTGKNGDIFQSTNIHISGRTQGGWVISGLLYDNKFSPLNDVYTISLKDANTAYLTIKRKRDSFLLGRYSLYGNKLDGGYFGFTHSTFTIRGGVGEKNGAIETFDTIIKPPYSIPIKITRKEIPIIEGSENVFIDGKILDKTQYRLDYTRGILFLYIKNSEVEHRLLVTYQYHTPFSPLMVYNLEGGLSKKFLKANAMVYRENRVKQMIPDSLGGVFYPEGGGDYEKQDSIFVYVGKGKGHYMVYFQLDTINGAYEYVKEGDYYVFVGKGSGHYTPERENVSHSINFNKISIKGGKDIFLKTTYIQSERINTEIMERGKGIEISAGIRKKLFQVEAGMRKTDGTVYLPYPTYNQSLQSYREKLENEKFADLTIGSDRKYLTLHSTMDSLPHWNTTISFNSIKLRFTGEKKLKETILLYKHAPLSLSLYYNRFNERIIGLEVNPVNFPYVYAFAGKDSVKINYGIFIKHNVHSKLSDFHFEIMKTPSFLTYNMLNTLRFNAGHLNFQFGRMLDMDNLYIERYIKTPSGTFMYDSASGRMLPSEFGEFTRIIIPAISGDLTYKNITSTQFYFTHARYSLTANLKIENTENEKRANMSTSFSSPFIYGTRFGSSFTSQNISTDMNKVGLWHVKLHLSIFTDKIMSPGASYEHQKDGLSVFEKKVYGVSLLLKRKKVHNATEIQYGSFQPFEKNFYTFKNRFNLSISKYTANVTTSYTNSTKIPFSTYLNVGVSYKFKVNTFLNVITLNGVFLRKQPARWQLTATVKF